MADIRITPASSIMSFTSSLNFKETLTQDASGSLILQGSGSTGRTDLLAVNGTNRRLFTVSDDLSDSLFSVNTIAGLPVIEAFADNTVKIGQYGTEAIKVIGSSAFITGSLNGGADFSRTSLVYNESTNATRYLVFASNGNGTPQTLYTNLGNLTYNPSTNTLTAGTFSGALSGNASTATALTSMNISQFTNNSGYTTNTGTVTSVGGTGTVNGITLTGTVSTTGNLTLGGTLGSITNGQLVNSAIQIGSTVMSLGNAYGDLTGLGTVRAGANGASSPPFAFTGDTNTGMYNVSADVLGFATGGSARLIINSSGDVGISTTGTPEGKLHVNQTTNLGGTAGNSLILQTLQNAGGSGGNVVLVRDYAVRDATGTTWTTWRHHNSIDVDGVYNTPGTNTRCFWERDPLSGVHYFGNSTAYTLTVDAGNSRVGVGTTSMVRDLQVGAFSGNPEICIGSGTTGTGALVFGDGATGNDPWRGFIIYNHSTDALTLGTVNAERMRITSGGSVGIGETSPTYKLQVNDTIASVTGFGNFTALQSIGGTGYRWTLANDSTFRLQYTTNGFSSVTTPLFVTSNGALGLNVTPTNTAGRFEALNDIVAYSSSDKRWKKNIKNINSPLEKLSQINGVEFDWIEDEPVHGNKGHDIGVIAQEIEQVLPEIVQTRESGMKAVQYDKIIPLLVECIKDQQKQIDELKQIINGITS
jgi:hypothetical protein